MEFERKTNSYDFKYSNADSHCFAGVIRRKCKSIAKL